MKYIFKKFERINSVYKICKLFIIYGLPIKKSIL